MNSKGFTLIEVLMVVVIIGILASVALPQYSQFVNKAKVSEAVGIASAVRSAEEMYKVQNGNYGGADLASIGVTVPTLQNWNAPVFSKSGSGTTTAYSVNFGMKSDGANWVNMTGHSDGTVSWNANPTYLKPQ